MPKDITMTTQLPSCCIVVNLVLFGLVWYGQHTHTKKMPVFAPTTSTTATTMW